MRIGSSHSIELISTIYEEFYNAKVVMGKIKAHTTPAALVELCSATR